NCAWPICLLFWGLEGPVAPGELVVAIIMTFYLYSMEVRLERKILWLALLSLSGVFLTGCGGLNASKGISPASFFLPGLGEAKPVPTPSQVPSAPAQPAPVKTES